VYKIIWNGGFFVIYLPTKHLSHHEPLSPNLFGI